MSPLNYLSFAFVVGAGLIGVFFYGWMNILKQTNALLKDQNAELKESHADLAAKYSESQTQIGKLSGQIDMLQSIPLSSIDATLKAIAESNKSILLSLQLSSEALKQNTTVLASHVEAVKTDLENLNK